MATRKVSRLQETKKSDQQLGNLIAAVLNHPDLPEGVYNSIGDSLSELQSKPGYGTRPETIQAAIDAAKGRAESKKPIQPSAIADQKFRDKAKAAVEAYEADVNKVPKTFTFTEEEFEELGMLGQAVFDLSKCFEEHGGEGLNHCLGLVAQGLDHLWCEINNRNEKGAGA